ncbi:SDR family NAD(P)-dependent oxidoreductase [Thalassotalea euphylliae]|uniref:SDR family NAD(P)-dependent oxidoreductase n=1 Tax=Thalassotalea euphylliae TaxID=1655234 RepID=UPI0036343954
MIKSIFITGANAGLGKEAAKQLAMEPGIKKVYLGCRNLDKAKSALIELQNTTGKDIFEIINIDVSNLNSVRDAVNVLPEPIDALIMNAGGTGGQQFNEVNEDGVTQIFAVNLLGHALLTEELIRTGKLKQVALYAGSEAARGVPEMGMKRPNFSSASVDEFITLANGRHYSETTDPTVPYGPIKFMAALWMSSLARQHTHIRFVTMSPGATTGTDGFNTLPMLKQYVMKGMMKVMLWLGKVHGVEQGARRYLDGVFDQNFKSGGFYASEKGLTGPLGDQGRIFSDINNVTFQDNAHKAISHFLR